MSGNTTIKGRLAADPEGRVTPNGKTAASLTVIVNHRRKTDTGWEDDGDPDIYRVTAWGRDAEHAIDTLRKGDLLIVQGTLRHKQYTKKDGTTGHALELSADWDSIGLVRPATHRNTPTNTPEDDPWTA